MRFALPIADRSAIVLAGYNYARFGNPFEFGHKFLAVQWQERMFRFGLFNYHFLSRNLAAALVLLPRIMTHCPYVKISQHGMSLLVTSPNLAYTVMPQEREPAATRAVAHGPDDRAAVAALPELGLHPVRLPLQPRLHDLLHGPAGDRQPAADAGCSRALVVVAFAINLFLAIIFDRYMQFSYDDTLLPAREQLSALARDASSAIRPR